MKSLIRRFILCMSVMFALQVHAQIQIESEGKTQTFSENKKNASYIHWIEDGFYFLMADYECSKYHLFGNKFAIKIFLGKTVKEVQQSGVILSQWFDGAKNENFITVSNPDGQKICLYKYNANLYASYGSEMQCKATRIQYGVDMTAALTGAAYKTKQGRDELMANIEFGDYILTGLCSFSKEFMKSIKNFKEPGQVSPEYRTKIGAQIAETKKVSREKDFGNSIVMQSYDLVVKDLMRSEQENDWKTIEQINSIVLDLLKNKSNISQQELENELSSTESAEEKRQIFERYYQKL